MPTISLTMIVRDEQDVIARCLASVRPHIASWCIVDTGSKDSTRSLIAKSLAGIPGRLHKRKWRNFGHNRSELMALARETADYLMLLDADMAAHVPDPLPPLSADVYHGRILGSLDYTLPILVRGEMPWRYEGVAHSYLACDVPFTEDVLPGLEIEDGSHTSVAKLERDLAALTAEHAANPLDARTAFYLAQTYYDLDRFDEAIAMYRYRANLTGWDEETYYACYQLGVLLCEHVSFAQGSRELLAAWEMRPSRSEALRALAGSARSVADKIPYPDDRLFVHRGAYAAPPAVNEGISVSDVSAVIVTRGNVDLRPIIESLPYDDVVIWNNAERAEDLKILGRYQALHECQHDIVYFQDDDVIFTAHDELLGAYEPGRIVANMDQPWVDACGYHDMVMVGAGAIADKDLFWPALERYLEHYRRDDEFLFEADFIVGTLVPGRQVDLGYAAREFSDDPDRLYQQPGQREAKERARARARAIRDGVFA